MMYHQKSAKFLRESQVAVLTGLSKSTRWRLEKDNQFPKRRQLSTKAVGWLASEIEEWVYTRVTMKTGKSSQSNNDQSSSVEC
ncbi:prophage regulatory protein [Gammaproteobacteria bacterium]